MGPLKTQNALSTELLTDALFTCVQWYSTLSTIRFLTSWVKSAG
jgi:hypothetical protein